MGNKLIVIVPALPPNISGVGDYALCQARALFKFFGIKSIFIVAGAKKSEISSIEEFPVRSVINGDALSLVEAVRFYMEKGAVLHLQYVGYGYQKRGVPLWLLSSIRTIRLQIPELKIICTLHELFAVSSFPWKSAFWLSRLQKHICMEIYLLSDEVITSCDRYFQQLQKFAYKSTYRMPVVSNFGEISNPLPLSQREGILVFFGAQNIRCSFNKHSEDILRFASQNNINKAITIGSDKELRLEGLHIESRSFLSPNEIASTLGKVYASFISIPSPELFSKSSFFAAICAHGCLPVTVGSLNNVDGLSSGQQFYNCHEQANVDNLSDIAMNAHRWYMGHNIEKNVALLNQLCAYDSSND